MGRVDANMPKGKPYGALNQVDQGQIKNEKSDAPGIKPRPTSAVQKLRSDNSIEKRVASTGAPQKLKGVKFEKKVNKKDVVPPDTTGSDESKSQGVDSGDGSVHDKGMKPTPAQRSAIFGSASIGQGLGYVPRGYWDSAPDLVKPDQTAVDHAAAIYYMK